MHRSLIFDSWRICLLKSVHQATGWIFSKKRLSREWRGRLTPGEWWDLTKKITEIMAYLKACKYFLCENNYWDVKTRFDFWWWGLWVARVMDGFLLVNLHILWWECIVLMTRESNILNYKIKAVGKFNWKYNFRGLPWWLSGEESTYQCRRHGSDPWSGKIPVLLAAKPVCYHCWACAREPGSTNYRS